MHVRLHVDLQKAGQVANPVVITVDDNASASALAQALSATVGADGRRHADASAAHSHRTISVHSHDGVVTVPPETAVINSGIKSGMTVTLVPQSSVTVGRGSRAAVTFRITDGPDLGKEVQAVLGSTVIGRDRSADIQLNDPTVSKRHARINAGETLEILDLGSANGVIIDGVAAPRAQLRVGHSVTLGNTVLLVVRFEPSSDAVTKPTTDINRSPLVEPGFAADEHAIPDPPQPPQRQKMPWLVLLAPLAMGPVLYFMTKRLASILFVLLSPLMMLASYLETRIGAKREAKRAVAEFGVALAAFRQEMTELRTIEIAIRKRINPSSNDVAAAINARSTMVWCRRVDRPEFLRVRLGLGELDSLSTIKVPERQQATPDIWWQVTATASEFRRIPDVPVVADLTECGSLGIAGPAAARLAVARGVLMQVVGLHSPADVVIAAFAPAQSSEKWDWLSWLPHVSSAASPLTCEPLASSPGSAVLLLAELEGVIAVRAKASGGGGGGDASSQPAVIVIVDSDAPAERARLVALAEQGPAVGIHLIWLEQNAADIPAACRDFVTIDGRGSAKVGKVLSGQNITPLTLEPLPEANTVALAKYMASWVDSGFLGSDDLSIPASVSYVEQAGRSLTTADGIAERWRETGSINRETAGKRRKAGSLRALVGHAADEPMYLDLRTDGPHALVGGTTGSGKSELLQTWIMGMATAHSPDRVTFLLVDYKGGSAFAECVNLPHCVGMVTDLTPHLVARAITSLDAELRYRERVLHRHRAKDLVELEKSGSAETMPSLVIVVDEFAALVNDVPEFVDGMVNIAQRGRSLGLHLILATQRPAGVIKDNLRANTNLRVALRLADAEDSHDVIGTDLASTFPQDIPGRAVLRTGPGRLKLFQTAYVGGWTGEQQAASVEVEDYRFGVRRPWMEPGESKPVREEVGPNDIQEMVTAAQQASVDLDLEPPRRPWLPVLANTYRLLDLPTPRSDAMLVIGARDEPDNQLQTITSFDPDAAGNMVIYGTGGTGKTVALRTIAAAAGLTARGGPCHVYGIDYGARGLSMLEVLPHVGSIISGDDNERVIRLLKTLREIIDERALRFAKVNAGSIVEYRALSGERDEPRILLLLDGFGGFRQNYEVGPYSKWYDVLGNIAADGRQVGVHLVLTVDRPGAVPPALSSLVQSRLVLRLAKVEDLSMLNVPVDALPDDSPPGRGFYQDREVQIAVLGGDPNVAAQAKQMELFAATLRRGGMAEAAPIGSLPESVLLSSLPTSVGQAPTLGLGDESLAPVGFAHEGVILVAGPQRSGRTTTVATLVTSYMAWRPSAKAVLFTGKNSPLLTLRSWTNVAKSADEAAKLAGELAESLAQDGAAPTIIVLENVAEFLNGSADTPLQSVIKDCRDYGHLVIAEGENSTVGGTWGLLGGVKAARQGIVLQPDQMDGDTLLRTPFPRVNRSEFPPGRGFYVSGGKVERVQVALPG